jgi:hypothetical protein
MFAITGKIEEGDPEYLTWAELHEMAATGRWDIVATDFVALSRQAEN